jgi:ribosomal protein S18 acetylase RimI-like enzyme/predicted transcriptional regulator
MSVVVVKERGPAFDAVLALAKTSRQTVGFLPDSAFRDRARQGTLLAVLDDEVVAGYVLYDLPRDEARIVQLVVAEAWQGRGLAHDLLEEVARRHPARSGILLHCRNDFPAHQIWPRLGFSPVGERIGRSIEGKPLTRWWKSFGHPNLLTLIDLTDSRPTAVLDSCAFFDVVAPERDPVIEQLRSDWIGDHVRLAITDEVLVDITKGKDSVERGRERAAASFFTTLHPGEALWRPFLDALKEAHPDAPEKDESDLRQIARGLGAQASWLVTTDPALQRRYHATAERLGSIRIVRPEQFLREIDELARSDWYRPVELARTTVTSKEVDAKSLGELAGRFVNHRDGEAIRTVRKVITQAASRPQEVHLQSIEVDGVTRGLLCYSLTNAGLRAELVRVSPGKGEYVLGRFLLRRLRDETMAGHLNTVRVMDRVPSPAVRRSMLSEGFEQVDDGYLAISVYGRGTLAELRRRLEQIQINPREREQVMALLDDDEGLAFRAEARFAPYRVLGTGIPNFVVPIRHGWATSLFDTHLAAEQLFPREWDLGLRRELVYYRRPRNDGGLKAPARILWYVSGTQRQPGGRSIRGVSLLNEVLVAPANHLFSRFGRLGVYKKQDVEALASEDGQVMALRFSDTELFDNPVKLDDYREIVSGSRGSRSVVLRSPQLINEQAFVEIHRRGTGRDD